MTTSHASDARLWSRFVAEIRDLRPDMSTASIEGHARQLVAWVRVEREQNGAMTWAPGERIPDRVMRVYDLDGDVWVRDRGGDTWIMPGFDPDDHEAPAEQPYGTDELLRRYGPLTEAPRRTREALGGAR